jgi:hypothetical protein
MSFFVFSREGFIRDIVTLINANVPHLLVFSRSNMKAELLDSAPPGSTAACHRTGWITKMNFTQWLNILSVL